MTFFIFFKEASTTSNRIKIIFILLDKKGEAKFIEVNKNYIYKLNNF